MPIQLSENTTVNNIAIIDNILIEQLGMKEEEFNDHPTILIGGDNKTLTQLITPPSMLNLNTSSLFQVYSMHRCICLKKAHWGVLPKEGKLSQARRHVGPGKARYADSRTFIIDCVQSRIVAKLLNHMNLHYYADNDEIQSRLNGYRKPV
jgi:hypothetical protein